MAHVEFESRRASLKARQAQVKCAPLSPVRLLFVDTLETIIYIYTTIHIYIVDHSVLYQVILYCTSCERNTTQDHLPHVPALHDEGDV